MDAGSSSSPTAPSVATTIKSMSVFVWTSAEMNYEKKSSTNVKVALGFLLFAFLFIIIAFSTPCWLEEGGELANPKFLRIGLWEGCFQNLKDDRHQYDVTLSGCYWLLAEELYHVNDLIFQQGNYSGEPGENWVEYGSVSVVVVVSFLAAVKLYLGEKVEGRSAQTVKIQSFRADYPVSHRTVMHDLYSDSTFMKKRTLAGKFAIGIFGIAVLLIFIAFCTPYWLESDRRIVGAKFEKLGLWTHCFRSLPDPTDQALRRFFTGCRWIFDPFTVGYSEIRSYLVPPFFVAVQFFFTMCFINLLIALVLVPMYLLCFGPDRPYYVLLIKVIGIVLLFSALLGTIAVIVFGAMGDSRAWMPDWQNNYLSWSFALAVVGVFAEYVSGILFFVESRIQSRKRKLRESYSGQTMETKA